MSKRKQAPWSVFPHRVDSELKLFNSLTRQKELFVPKDESRVTWYSCGPTVYDASHMGHARSYITFDILRRILSDYFGYNIFYIMNITDIDDKIIKRARQNYLYEEYVAENNTLEKVLDDARSVIDKLGISAKTTADNDKKQMLERLLDKLVKSVEGLEMTIKSGDSSKIEASQKQFLMDSKDPLSDWLDSKLGSTVTDNAIFSTLPAYWEEEFHKDMDALHVLRPHVLTRVSEYVPEIVEYIERIISNGLGYESNGSVYFDVNAFDGKPCHHYAKLVPEAYGDANSLQEGEGDLTSSDAAREKRSPNDFALWKKSKAGEPSWESPWGRGRPGWHIECSAMASAIAGPQLDIHTGGVDLKFPHHDNEIAQTEAYYGTSEWVKYFLHSGHLTIAGCKMSKSLKNFVSIQDALAKYTARQLRFAFLLHSWKDTLDYSDNTMEIALQSEKVFSEFFLNIKDTLNNLATSVSSTSISATFTKWSKEELALNQQFQDAKVQVHVALCDNVDTRSALDSLRELVTACNVYLRDHGTNNEANAPLLRDIATYITWILRVFGTMGQAADNSAIGFPVGGTHGGAGNLEDTILPYLRILAQFRDDIRVESKKQPATAGPILGLCDHLRDAILPEVGVRLEDRENAPTAVKVVDKETLMREREAKRRAAEEKQLEKERKRAELEAQKAAKDAQKRIKPDEMFTVGEWVGKYGQFDENGLPTHETDGKEVSKGQLKKLQKLYQTQKKLYEEFIASQN